MIFVKEIEAVDTYAIRKDVLREGMTLSHKMAGDEEDSTLHLGLFESDQLVCIGSFMKASKAEFDGIQYQLRGMASTKKTQGKGYGRQLLQTAEQKLRDGGVDMVWCNARTIAVNFYKKLGYKTAGEVFEVEQVGPHYLMFKNLT
ncbi:GNAT family N-acetyltransferase [Lutimonas sp.]|uniref:GNAT family N-acetyltransferase n=1 Tax=Lutimonas sp. TaxID=1872403 RepID=UPI003D9ACB42